MEFTKIGEIELDARGRTNFGRLGKKGRQRYFVEEGQDGVLRLIPVVSVPVSSLLFKNQQKPL